ncbi:MULTISPECIES: UDP-2,4-diacetamido-2,4,6-trideoxy-beta-L-altropyranose hydrolase [Pseudanabaena]|uniref:Pseudaminic acid biosynthesis-associated protein PseG n=2 Tax=Pseudanabaena TaxID=1152 RepID=L8N5D1_9CYAN|nr:MULTISPECIES: UDP-2,4-diacetamido-2,4,6-trideoxy-beta-L-altropyranose hydrolase [Pseudanabaena]ELS34319.1 pseudaminic acid biosynthesis-associated protein PseG [Pseudanabaena biceps PCC 7429]MDG3493461.1 UDP-2,4-diacetamido-2,4,6-trideoxy-beta-L-altropyranose hydrolase [Pseudanabaena catenata USMAC16]
MIIKKLIIRADASIQVGTGHVMRCLALAQAWQDKGGEVIFILANKSTALENRLRSEGMKVVHLLVKTGSNEDVNQTVDFAQKFNAQWIVVDGYHFGAKYQKYIKDFGINLLFIDDYGHTDYYYADLVLNQNISAHKDLYQSREIYTQLLLGTQYVLLRREFWQWRDWQRAINPIARKLLITFGGSDPDNVTLKVIQALEGLNRDDLAVIVVIGGSNPHHEVLQKEIANSSLAISLQRNVSNMPELMAWADLAITAGGSTNWELAFMGLPSIVITVAENQKEIATELDTQGIIIHIGWYQQITLEKIGIALQEFIYDQSKRAEMSQKGKKLVNGYGAVHVTSKIANILS